MHHAERLFLNKEIGVVYYYIDAAEHKWGYTKWQNAGIRIFPGCLGAAYQAEDSLVKKWRTTGNKSTRWGATEKSFLRKNTEPTKIWI